jgi:ATP adenylyltransferase/5',5'''-P-1,P-4-tetraphosphate phosphorylase II
MSTGSNLNFLECERIILTASGRNLRGKAKNRFLPTTSKKEVSTMKKCTHDLAERETACADGLCPICLQELCNQQRLLFADWEKASDARMRKYKLLLKDNTKLRKRVASLELFDPEQQQ